MAIWIFALRSRVGLIVGRSALLACVSALVMVVDKPKHICLLKHTMRLHPFWIEALLGDADCHFDKTCVM